jgi:hypothetical protein
MTVILLGALAFAVGGFLAGRGFANAMDIGGEGLRGLYICYGTAAISGLVGAGVMAAGVWA